MDRWDVVFGRYGWRVGEEILCGRGGSGDEGQYREEEGRREKHLLECSCVQARTCIEVVECTE